MERCMDLRSLKFFLKYASSYLETNYPKHRMPPPVFSSWIFLTVHCQWTAAVDCDLAFVKLDKRHSVLLSLAHYLMSNDKGKKNALSCSFNIPPVIRVISISEMLKCEKDTPFIIDETWPFFCCFWVSPKLVNLSFLPVFLPPSSLSL